MLADRTEDDEVWNKRKEIKESLRVINNFRSPSESSLSTNKNLTNMSPLDFVENNR